MAFSVYGLDGWVPQPDFRASQQEAGGWEGTQTFVGPRSAVNSTAFNSTFKKGIKATDLDTNLNAYWSFMVITRVGETENMRGGLARVAIFYNGFPTNFSGGGGENPAELPVYELSGSREEQPITTHPQIRAFGYADRLIIEGILNGQFVWHPTEDKLAEGDVYTGDDPFVTLLQPTVGEEATWAKRVAQGKRTHKVARLTWRKSWSSENSLTQAQVDAVNTQSNPTGAPSAPSGQKWMVSIVGQRNQGTRYDISVEWITEDDESFEV